MGYKGFEEMFKIKVQLLFEFTSGSFHGQVETVFTFTFALARALVIPRALLSVGRVPVHAHTV